MLPILRVEYLYTFFGILHGRFFFSPLFIVVYLYQYTSVAMSTLSTQITQILVSTIIPAIKTTGLGIYKINLEQLTMPEIKDALKKKKRPMRMELCQRDTVLI